MHTGWWCISAAVLFAAAPAATRAEQAAPLSALARMPVREITVFKDGHAFVQHQGRLPTDAHGNVEMDYLPTPVLGTFWPYCLEKDARLRSVTARRRRVLVERTALTLQDLLSANQSLAIRFVDLAGKSEEGRIVGIPERTSEELEADDPPNAGEKLPERSRLVLIKTNDGVEALPIDRIQTLTIRGATYKSRCADEVFRNLLTLKLDWANGTPAKTAEVGMFYLQKGFRWIPSYKVNIDGKGGADVKLQATLINELTDLEDATVNLVIGVPSFAFKETLDPIALQQTLASLSPYMQRDSSLNSALSNSIAAQAPGVSREGEAGDAQALNIGPEVAGSGKNEDLFVFTVKHVSLKKGERMNLTVADYVLDYKDVYRLDIPAGPAPVTRRRAINLPGDEGARLVADAGVIHSIRLVNSSKQPLTTAPTLVFEGDHVLAQGLMTYTSAGAADNLTLTTATDIRTTRTERETARTPNAVTWNTNSYGRVDLAGEIRITNFGPKPVTIEVKRSVLGNVDQSDHGGKAEMVNVLDDTDAGDDVSTPREVWPAWWTHFNGVGRIHWKLTLKPGQSEALGYTWHYFGE